MKIQSIILLCFLLVCSTTWAQVSSLEKKASVAYKDLRLEDALIDLNEKYGLKFCYSSNYIPLDKKITITLAYQPLRLILDALFSNIDVVYFVEGDQFILRKLKKKKSKLTGAVEPEKRKKTTEKLLSINVPKARLAKSVSVKTPRKAKKKKASSPVISVESIKTHISPKKKQPEKIKHSITPSITPSANPVIVENTNLMAPFQELSTLDFDRIGGKEEYPAINLPIIKRKIPEVLGQVSILPSLSTNRQNRRELTNKVSFNIFWGRNGGVDGFEAGGFVNSIKYDVKGVQLAGLGNIVDGELEGTQVSGLFNHTKGKAKGFQGAGLFNLSGDTESIQVAGLGNIAKGNFTGVQMAGLGNIAYKNAGGTQVASLFNISKAGTAKTQISTLFNQAEDVSRGQVSLFFNKAKKVEGFQFALVNICDTITGSSIGLLNFVKKGYNRFEINTGTDLHLVGSFKFGSLRFYNIIQLGTHWNEDGLSWALGYGFGRTMWHKERSHYNLELIVLHINENEKWTDELNLLTQFRFTYDLKMKKGFSLFIGPSLNTLFSEKIQLDPLDVGSGIPPYNFSDTTSGSVNIEADESLSSNAKNIQIWIGINAGIRF